MSLAKDLSHHRRNYVKHELIEGKISTNPYAQFAQWFDDAGKAELLEPNAMTLATATGGGKPSARVVLLKAFSKDGFVFYTNYHSRKGAEMAENNQAAILFYWDAMERQVRIEGVVEKVELRLSDEYFASRPYESRLSAIASEQSEVIPSRQFLEDRLEEVRNVGIVKRPENWGGYVLKPQYFEFWQGRSNRLHDRIVYTLENGAWAIKRLAP